MFLIPELGLPVLGSGSLNCFKGPQDPGPDLPGSIGISRLIFCRYVFAVFFDILFSEFYHQKASQNGVQIDPKSMKSDVGSLLEKSIRRCIKNFDFSVIFQKADVLKS